MTDQASTQERADLEAAAPATAASRSSRPGLVRIVFTGLVMVAVAFGLVLGGSAPSAEAKTKYVTTKYQGARYGTTSAKVRNVQLRLADAGFLKDKYVTSYYGDITKSAVKDFRRSVGMKAGNGKKVTKKTWRALVKKSGKVKIPGAGSGGKKKGKLNSRCYTNDEVLCIDKTKSQLYFVKKGKILKQMDARFGCAGSRTREGTFTVFRKVRHDWSYQYESKMPLSMYFSGGQAVHYSSDFNARGYAGCSHGCVNIRDKGELRYVYNRIEIGDRVVVYWS
jgi:lipoprotein-anchoring transpeptidase ErfK/SrfK